MRISMQLLSLSSSVRSPVRSSTLMAVRARPCRSLASSRSWSTGCGKPNHWPWPPLALSTRPSLSRRQADCVQKELPPANAEHQSNSVQFADSKSRLVSARMAAARLNAPR